MTSTPLLDTTEAPAATTQPLSVGQRRFVLAFSIFTAVTVVAFLIVTAQVDAVVGDLTNNIARHLIYGK